MTSWHRGLAGLVLIVWLAPAGCDPGRKLARVEGTVRLDGKPLAGASVSFVAQDADGRTATGFTDADGGFRLSTFEPNDGAYPGRYKVVVQPPAAEAVGPAGASQDELLKAAGEGKVKVKKSPVVVPGRYSHPDQTPFVQDVPASGPVTLELQSK